VALDGKIHGGHARQEAAGKSAEHLEPDVEGDAAVFFQNCRCRDAVGYQKSQTGPEAHGSNSVFSQSTKKPKKSDVAPASWWGGSEKTSEPPKTVNDFLSMPRP